MKAIIAAAGFLDAAKWAGVTVTLGTEGRLALKADARPPDDVIAVLRQHKPAIIALLSTAPSLPVVEDLGSARPLEATLVARPLPGRVAGLPRDVSDTGLIWAEVWDLARWYE